MKTLISIFKALADRNRLRAFAALNEYEELCACQITELLEIAGATVSRHMGLLVFAGIVLSRKEGRWVYYRLNQDQPDFDAVFNWMKKEFAKDPDIQHDRIRLAEITALDPEELCRRQRGEICCPREQV